MTSDEGIKTESVTEHRQFDDFNESFWLGYALIFFAVAVPIVVLIVEVCIS